MEQFDRQFFPEGTHKLKPTDIDQAEDYLERDFSDDVSVAILLPMIETEDNNSTFKHPSNQDSLNILNMDPRVDINATNKNGLP